MLVGSNGNIAANLARSTGCEEDPAVAGGAGTPEGAGIGAGAGSDVGTFGFTAGTGGGVTGGGGSCCLISVCI